ncbi:MAG: 50S ribosomal protein L35 [Phycisphaerae bacterium]
MAYKFKPSKSVSKRFKVTGTGKLKRGHQFRSHLMSGRSGDMKRRMGRPAILDDRLADRCRAMMGVSKNPKRIAHERRVRDLQQAKAEQAA